MNTRYITQIDDPALVQVMDIYQKAFPPEEQMLASFFIKILKDPSQKLAVVEADGLVRGFIQWQTYEPGSPCYLCYLAVDERYRGQGIGEYLYRFVLDQCDPDTMPAMLFEIEHPDEARKHGPAAETMALRRQGWYQRLGAKVIEGTHFICGTDWFPGIPMKPMIHSVVPVSPQEAFDWAMEILADDNSEKLRQMGELSLV